LILADLAGLALTNHMSAASAVLGTALTGILAYRRELARRIPVLLVMFLLGVSPYLFLVLRARAGPLFAWGDPYSLERLYWHVTGRQYQVWMFSQSFDEVLRNAGRGAALLARSFVYVLVPVVFYGVVRLFRQRRNLAIGLALSAVFAFAYAANYSIPDIESYYLPCLVALAVFGMVGLDGVMSSVERRVSNAGPAVKTMIRQVPWLAGILALLLNFRTAGKQGDYVARDNAVNTLTSAGQDATVITDWWDVYSPVFYLQHVEQARPDVCMIDKELLRRSWYFKYLARAYPWLVERSAREIAQYREYLDQFEHSRLRDPGEIQRRYIAMLESFVTRNPERPAYTTFDADAGADAKQLLPGVARIPVGLLFQLRSDTLVPEFDYARLQVRLPRYRPDMRTMASLERYRFLLTRRAQILAARGRGAEVNQLVDWYQSSPASGLFPLTAR